MMKTHFLQKFLRVQSEFPFVQLSLQSNTFSPSSKHFQSATSSGSLSFFFVKIIDTNIKYEELWRFRSNFKMSAPKKEYYLLIFFLAKCLYRHCKKRHLFSRKLIDVFRFQYVQDIFSNFFGILISHL